MGGVFSCCDPSRNHYRNDKGTELTTKLTTTGGPTTSSQKQQHREDNWKKTGIIGLRDLNTKELPASIADVGLQAQVLDASNNRLKTLPEQLGKLEKLQRLVLINNLLVTLPPVVCTLLDLKLLNVDSNRLTELPEELGQLSKLEKLSANNNALTTLPTSMAGMSRLTILMVSRNKLEALPTSLPPELEELDASHNSLTAIPPSLGALQKLKILTLDSNHVPDVPPEVLEGCAALHTLSLHANPITADMLTSNRAYAGFEERRRSKYTKAIAGGVLLGSKGLDEGVDRHATRSP